MLNRAGLGTLVFDLLTPAEEFDRTNVFDIPLLARRLLAVTAWLREQPEGRHAAIGCFGASTGAGAALWAAAEPDAQVAAVVSRGRAARLRRTKARQCPGADAADHRRERLRRARAQPRTSVSHPAE
jgi:dienelactone hydrolase